MSELAFDAQPRDPTGTLGHRRAFRAAGKLRVNQLRAAMRVAIMDQDVLGISGLSSGVMAYHPLEVRLRAFAAWLDVMAYQILDGPWLSQYVAKAWQSGEVAAAKQLNTNLAGESSAHVLELARLELEGIIAAIVQQVSREASRIVARGRIKRSEAWRRLSECLDKVAPPRIMALANTITVMAHNKAKISSYRVQGVDRVGVIAENLPRPRHYGDADVDFIKGEAGRFAGSRGHAFTEQDVELNALWKAAKQDPVVMNQYSDAMLHRCKDIAKQMFVDPDSIHSSLAVQKGDMGVTLATTDMAGTKITMMARVCDPQTFPGTLVHEITHIKYTALRNEYKVQRASVEDALGQMSPQERAASINPDGTLNGPLAEMHPIYQEFTSLYDVDALQKEGGVTPYSKAWWAKTKGGHYYSSAVYETLAEMARMKIEKGELPGGPRHQALYALMNQHWYTAQPKGFKT